MNMPHFCIRFSCSFCADGSLILNIHQDTANLTCIDPHHQDVHDAVQKDLDFQKVLMSRLVDPSCLQYQLFTGSTICLATFHTPILWDPYRITQFNQYSSVCSNDNLRTTLCDYGSPECFSPDRICSFERDILGNPVHCTDTGHLRFCESHECPDAFKCPESYCIAIHMVCDMIPDCPDGEDESGCRSLDVRGMFRYVV